MKGSSSSSVSVSFSTAPPFVACASLDQLLAARESGSQSDLCAAIARTRREDSISIASDSLLRTEYSAALVDCFMCAQDSNDVSCQNWCVVLLADLLPEHDPVTEVRRKFVFFVCFLSSYRFGRLWSKWVLTRMRWTNASTLRSMMLFPLCSASPKIGKV